MEKDLMKKKFGLPPMPPLGPGAPPRRNIQRKKDFSPLSWSNYFDNRFEVDTGDGDVFCVYSRGSEGPVLLFLHGGGFSGLSWALLSQQITSMVQCRCIAVDQRGHGETRTSDDSNLSVDQMTSDIGNLVSRLFPDESPPIVLVGHSMGGAIAIHLAERKLIPGLIGLAVIDVVEGTAMDALTSMQSFLRSRPKSFESVEKAIEWAVKSGQIQNTTSARISMIGQLKCVDPNESSPNAASLSSNVSDAIKEEDEEVEGELSSMSTSSKESTESRSSPGVANQGQKYTWRIDLSKTEPFWKGWFSGLSQKFLSCSPAKVLILAGHDRLDKDLTIGQMQGKFQMNLLPQSGHAVHEDAHEKVADILVGFMVRQKVAQPIGGFDRVVPGC